MPIDPLPPSHRPSGRLPERAGDTSPRRARPTACAIIAALLAVAPAAAAADDEAERALLRKSWEQACAPYDEATNWTARQACNLAWFRAHEKGVWEHNLNPHGPAAAGPSS